MNLPQKLLTYLQVPLGPHGLSSTDHMLPMRVLASMSPDRGGAYINLFNILAKMQPENAEHFTLAGGGRLSIQPGEATPSLTQAALDVFGSDIPDEAKFPHSIISIDQRMMAWDKEPDPVWLQRDVLSSQPVDEEGIYKLVLILATLTNRQVKVLTEFLLDELNDPTSNMNQITG